VPVTFEAFFLRGSRIPTMKKNSFRVNRWTPLF